MGAAVSTFLGYLASATLTYVVAQRVHPVPYRGARVLSVFVIALALGIALATSAPAGLPGVLAKLGVLAVFIGVCATLRIWKSQGAVGRWPATP